ncbi:unnamed protein product [Larinioides sclopetarius]|uniref:Uncharacterized protein n=1 Tax=Larinioides sclopetarius TaxID=280406 RepID=A0AAV1ZU96_9ARAC
MAILVQHVTTSCVETFYKLKTVTPLLFTLVYGSRCDCQLLPLSEMLSAHGSATKDFLIRLLGVSIVYGHHVKRRVGTS